VTITIADALKNFGRIWFMYWRKHEGANEAAPILSFMLVGKVSFCPRELRPDNMHKFYT
jgi:hypothetical protein